MHDNAQDALSAALFEGRDALGGFPVAELMRSFLDAPGATPVARARRAMLVDFTLSRWERTVTRDMAQMSPSATSVVASIAQRMQMTRDALAQVHALFDRLASPSLAALPVAGIAEARGSSAPSEQDAPTLQVA
jgi:hypothetical protein